MPGCTFLHLLTGLKATYESHVLVESPLNLKSGSFEQSIVGTGLGNELGFELGTKFGVLHFFLHVPGQNFLTFFPVPGCSFLHLLTGLKAMYESHVLDDLPSNLKSRSFEQSMVGAGLGNELGFELWTKLGAPLGSRLGTELGASLGTKLGMKLGTALGKGLGRELGAKLTLGSAVALGTVLGTALVLGALLKLGTALGNELGERLGKKLGSIDVLGLELGKELGSSLGGKNTVAFIPWSVSKSLANFPEEIASSISPTAF